MNSGQQKNHEKAAIRKSRFRGGIELHVAGMLKMIEEASNLNGFKL